VSGLPKVKEGNKKEKNMAKKKLLMKKVKIFFHIFLKLLGLFLA